MTYSLQVTNGGRSLNAIWDNENLDIYQSSILHYLGAQLDFRGDFLETRWVSVTTLCKKCKMKRTTAFKAIKFLQDNKYITKHHRYYEGRQIANAYAITEKIFQEYDILLENKCSKEITNKISRPLDEPQEFPKRIPEGSPEEPQRAAKRTQNSLPSSLKNNPSLSPSFSEKTETEVKIIEHVIEQPEPIPQPEPMPAPKPEQQPKSKAAPRIERQPDHQSIIQAKPIPSQAPHRVKPMASAATKMTATAVLSFIFKQTEIEEGKPRRFFDQAVMRQTAEIALEKYGLAAIYAFRDEIIKSKQIGRIAFDANVLFEALERISKDNRH